MLTPNLLSDGPRDFDSHRCSIHKHKKGECWLKHESNITGPYAAGPTLPRALREAKRENWPWAVSEKVWPGGPPERLTWQSGIVAPIAAPAWRAPKQPGWYHRFCKKIDGGCGPEPTDDLAVVEGKG